MPLSPVVAAAVLLYFTEEGAKATRLVGEERKAAFSSFPFADQVSEVERLPRSGGLSGHLIHAGMPNDFLFITRKGNGIYRKKPL